MVAERTKKKMELSLSYSQSPSIISSANIEVSREAGPRKLL